MRKTSQYLCYFGVAETIQLFYPISMINLVSTADADPGMLPTKCYNTYSYIEDLSLSWAFNMAFEVSHDNDDLLKFGV